MPETASPQYTLGWEHGYQAARAGKRLKQAEPSKATVALAGGVFLVGLSSAAAAVLYRTDHPLKEAFGVLSIAGILLGATLSSMRVLKGEPSPQLGIQI